MNIIATALPGVIIIEPKIFGDARGFFLETFQAERYRSQVGIDLAFVQDNHSFSRRGVLRGLHYQRNFPQGKLVRVVRGEVYDVAVDINPESRTYGTHVGVLLSGTNRKQLYVPPGYAHGFQVVSDEVDFEYKCTDYYRPDDEGSVAWNDPAIGIEWPIAEAILSGKDSVAPCLRDVCQMDSTLILAS